MDNFNILVNNLTTSFLQLSSQPTFNNLPFLTLKESIIFHLNRNGYFEHQTDPSTSTLQYNPTLNNFKLIFITSTEFSASLSLTIMQRVPNRQNIHGQQCLRHIYHQHSHENHVSLAVSTFKIILFPPFSSPPFLHHILVRISIGILTKIDIH